MATLEDLLERLKGRTPEELRALEQQADQVIGRLGMSKWQPNPGAQHEAFFSEADETGFGGEAGPGKTALIVGLSITAHQRSLLLRRTNTEALDLLDEYERFLGSRPALDKTNSFRYDGRRIQIGGCNNEADKQKFKGRPNDLIAFDELPDFTESQFTFIIQWNRSTRPGQRCRVVATFNPPTQTSGLWVIRRYAPWLDPTYPRPAKSGELRWFTTIDGQDTEVDGPGPHLIEGEQIMAKSRTFIRGHLEENVELAQSGYDATRAAAPGALRSAYRAGDFEAALQDKPGQCIPTAWVRAAMNRWTPHPPPVPMCAIADDASGGGADPMVLAIRHDGWYAELVQVEGKDIPIDRAGAHCAGIIMGYRKDQCGVIVDMGGGYGASTYEQLKGNGVEVRAYKGAESAAGMRTRDGQRGFKNLRTAVYWKFREALDPDQPGGSPISLPPDPLLMSELCAPLFEDERRVEIVLQDKDEVIKSLGRSTNRADAVVMCWHFGPRYIVGGEALARFNRYHGYSGAKMPQVIMGRGRYNRRR